jgi:hypothetical protein
VCVSDSFSAWVVDCLMIFLGSINHVFSLYSDAHK